MPPSAVLLFKDKIILHLFPEWPRAWSLKVEQATIVISGKNAKAVLIGTIDICTRYQHFDTSTQDGSTGLSCICYAVIIMQKSRVVDIVYKRFAYSAQKSGIG